MFTDKAEWENVFLSQWNMHASYIARTRAHTHTHAHTLSGVFSPLCPAWDLLVSDMPPSAWLFIAPEEAGIPDDWYGHRRQQPQTRKFSF